MRKVTALVTLRVLVRIDDGVALDEVALDEVLGCHNISIKDEDERSEVDVLEVTEVKVEDSW